MTRTEKIVNNLTLGLIFSIINWFLINKLIVKMTFIEYLLIEIVLVISIKLFKFTQQKTEGYFSN